MKVLIVGNGAREHIIAEKLSEDAEVYAVMSKKNPAIAQLSKKYWLCDIESATAVAGAIAGEEFDLGFSSPDSTLAAGVSDALAKHGMLVASPTKAAARIEWDKAFMRGLLEKHRIHGSPEHALAKTGEEAARAVRELGQVAVKPLGLTGGKGVRVSGDHFISAEEAVDYACGMIKKDGQVLIESKLVGEEFTLQAFCDGTRIASMPPVQDHKRAFSGDKGPNTGGMGSYSTGELLPFIGKGDIEQAKRVMQDVVHAMRKEGCPFTGTLYGQFMATADGVKVIEFNARFGDPEAINVLALLETSLVDMFLSMADARLEAPKFSSDATVVKYLVPDGYPEKPAKDREVRLDGAGIEKAGARVYYASVYENAGRIFTTGSRAFGMLGRGGTLEEAERIAESACACVSGPVWHRNDIGTKELAGMRASHMRELRGT